jgi:hypothetical protein
MGHRMIFTTVYTPEYCGQADRCLKTAARRHLTIFAEALPSLGSWDRNTLLKHDHLLRMFDLFPNDDLWFLDADSTILHNPVKSMEKLIAEHRFDISMCWGGWPTKKGHGVNRPGGIGWGRWHAGSIVMPAGGKRREIIEHAKRIIVAEGLRPAPEEHAICEAILRMSTVKCWDMPRPYCQIFDRGEWEKDTTYIVQNQASRQLKKVVNRNRS